MRHLLTRMSASAREGYGDYLTAEESLTDSTPMRMSRLTRRILASVDLALVAKRRRENFRELEARLGQYNTHKWELDEGSVPLCYPLVVDGEVHRIKKQLAERGIYVPTYWPEYKPGKPDGVEARLTYCCLPIPCDQRYSVTEITDLATEIHSALKAK